MTPIKCRLHKPERSPYWQIRYTLPGGKERAKSLRVRDRRTAERMMGEFITEHEREAIGLLPSRRIRETASADLLALLEGYLNDLRAQKCAPKHVENTGRNVRKLAESCRWKRISDVKPEDFTAWRARQGDKKSAKTLNEYLTSIRAFLKWLVETDRLPENPLQRVARVKQFEERRKRRAITDEQASRLLAVAPPERRLVYLVAMHTGLRRSEMATLEWRDVHLETESPFIKLRAENTKNRKGDTVCIHAELWNALIDARPADFNGRDRVLRIFNKLHLFKKDLQAAGIPFLDENGERFDLHSMRKTLCTRMANGNVPTRIAMQQMRHSEERLTTKVYTDVSRLPVAEHVNGLPALFKRPEVSRIVSQKSAPQADSATRGNTKDPQGGSLFAVQVQPLEHVLTHTATFTLDGEDGSGGRARTYDLVVNSHPLYR